MSADAGFGVLLPSGALAAGFGFLATLVAAVGGGAAATAGVESDVGAR